jgi:hypothetical protein
MKLFAQPTKGPFPLGRRPAPGGWRAEHGFTIVEVMVAALVLIVGGLSLVALVDAANGATTSNQRREAGTNLAREVIENVGTIAYDDVTPAGVIAALQARSGLADTSANTGYTLERRGVTFTVELEICNLDDASDGIGSHATGSDGVPFCSGSVASGSADDRPGDYRRATANVSWTREGNTKNVRQSSFVMPPSGSDLPVVTTLTPSPSSPIEDPLVEEVDFSATTSSIPAGVSWSQDGTDKDDATGSGTGPWNFTWPIGDTATGLADGSYVIGARGRTGGGSYGPVHALTMKLNRRLPVAPEGFVAGKNGTSVDAEWRANRERDVAGYTVYRQKTAPTTGAVEQVNCGTVGTPVYRTTSLTCTDASPLAFTNAISFVSASPLNANTSETSTLSVTTPSGVVAGDVMIATIASATGAAVTAPAGWTAIRDAASTAGGNGIRHASYYRVVPSGTQPASYAWALGANRSSSGSITAWRGVDTTTPIDASAQQLLGSNGAAETAPTVTTTRANGVVLRAFAHRGPSNNPPKMVLTSPASYTFGSGSRSFSTIHAQYSRTQATVGATGSATSTCGPSCTQWVAHTIALKAKDQLSANYWVKALDLTAAGNYREGAASNTVDPYLANTPPDGARRPHGHPRRGWLQRGGLDHAGHRPRRGRFRGLLPGLPRRSPDRPHRLRNRYDLDGREAAKRHAQLPVEGGRHPPRGVPRVGVGHGGSQNPRPV